MREKKLNSILLMLIFIIAVFSKVYGDLFYVYYKQENIIIYIKQILIIISIIFMVIINMSRKKQNRKLTKQFFPIFIFFYYIIIYSVIQMLLHSNFTFNFIKTTAYLIIPVIYTILIVKTLSYKEINSMLRISVILTISILLLFYIKKGLSLSDILRIDFLKSDSPFENEFISGISMSFFIFFNFFRKKNSFFLLVSILLVLLTFKRMAIIYLFILFLSYYLKKNKKKVNPKWIPFFSFLVFISIIFSKFIYSPDGIYLIQSHFPSIDLRNFMMGRDGMLLNLFSENYKSYGFGSLEDYLGYLFEIEGLRIYFELGFLGTLIFSTIFWLLSKHKFYLFMVSSYIYINIITSSMLIDFMGFIIIYLSYYYINDQLEDEGMVHE